MTEARCGKTDLLQRECAHCRPVLSSVASTPDQGRRAAQRSRTQQKAFADSTEASDLEVVARFLPAGLVDLYARLLEVEFGAVNLGGPASPRRDELVGVGRGSGPRTSTSHTETRSVTRSTAGGANRVMIRSERAVWGRYKLDRKLKRLVADLKNLLAEIDSSDGARPTHRQCMGKCRKFGDPDWLYCARCGGPMLEIDA